MLLLSDILIQQGGTLQSFDDLLPIVREQAKQGERFFQMDLKPPFGDTPDDWEDRLEACFSGLLDR